ncbi:hypothetical protein GCM10023148_29630 [Actinokineospora soli]
MRDQPPTGYPPPMTQPTDDRRPATEDAPDFAEEHTSPTFADEPAPEPPDEAVPDGYSGMDQEPVSEPPD